MQTSYGTVLQFLNNQLSSHAAAAAYYFLLSIAPLVLVVVSILNTSLVNYPELTAELFAFLVEFNEELNEDFFRRIGILETQAAVSGLGLLGVLWTSRLIISSIQSAFGAIFPSDRSRNIIWSNVLSLVLVPGVLTLLLLSTLTNVILRFLHGKLEEYFWLIQIYDLLLSLSGFFVPLALVFALIFICYRFLPLSKPKTWHAVLGAGLCTLSIHGLKLVFLKYASLASYNYVYGSLGVVIFLLLWVYLVFLLFFLFAQLVEVAGRVDILALDRIIAPRKSSSGMSERLENRLFGSSRRIFSKYSLSVPAGDIIYRDGDQEKDIYYLHSGKVELLAEAAQLHPRHLAVIEPGHFFGETAYLLNQQRISTARAMEASELFLISPELFEGLLTHSPAVSRKIISSLVVRLKQKVTDTGLNQ
ncbi:YhjD/YihY/BrkB family envelope integrity protein [Desulfobulbus alkaliphilus]|uniref:YhjD/YihY/BrkB family envelope integrity protein n=1 Tax=Desulfobulbus alkaliphilus TaxID=869814 RepID=UPI0019626613|nr:YhjD/YihY/BrkB family envelope integrity protein [Desulfobulbus alkaliphilus]MBM9538496.1 YihY family inner membrane protein [Desulfobulbus alkaliphilus]